MARRFFFITGLPRSGSTLLSAILRQNPKLHAGMSSPVGALTSAVRVMMSRNPEIETLIDDEGRKRVLTGLFESYYSHLPDDVIVFDTNRGWSIRIPELMALFPDVKLVATVRDPAWVFDSTEKIIRQNPLRQSSMVQPGTNMQTRARQMTSSEGFIGGPLGSLKEAAASPESHRMLLLEYDALCAAPEKALDAIYQFTGLERFEHDFSWVEYQEEAFDAALKTPGLHTVKGPVEYKPRKTLLPVDIFQQLSAQAFWGEKLDTQAAQILSK
ncbi:MAG: sulfotransferase [Pseudomonadota bacterium]